MGFVGELLNSESGIAWYYIAGLLIFVVLFILILYRTLRMKRSDVQGIKESLFEPGETGNNKFQPN